MRRDVALALGVATISGVLAVNGISSWMAWQSDMARQNVLVPAEPKVDLTTIVIAKNDIAFGAPVTAEDVKTVDWPRSSVPKGAYRDIAQMMGEYRDRVALEPILAEEPIVGSKITGPGQRASLSSMISEGMKAVSIRVDDVYGVSGFVLPGDRVNILLTRKADKNDQAPPINGLPAGAKRAYTDVLLKNVRVLAVDQIADPKHSKPALARTVTVETKMEDAQRIMLAGAVGVLSLALSKSGAIASASKTDRINVSDLIEDSGDKNIQAAFLPSKAVAEPAKPKQKKSSKNVTVTVVRAAGTSQYSVLKR